MNAPTIILGTIKPDGTLELNQQPNLPPGPVQVSVQSLPTAPAPQRRLADVLDAIHQSQQARGYPGRSAADIDAGLEEGEGEYEQKLQTFRSQTSGPLAGGS